MLLRSFTLSLSRYTRNILVSREFELAAPMPSIERRLSCFNRQLESSISIWRATRTIFRSVRIVSKKFIDGTTTKRQRAATLRAALLRTPSKHLSAANKFMGVNYSFGKIWERRSCVWSGDEIEKFTKNRVDRSGLREIRFLRPVLGWTRPTVQRCTSVRRS